MDGHDDAEYAVASEGIERAQQEDLVKRERDLLQGYLFAKPMPWCGWKIKSHPFGSHNPLIHREPMGPP